MSPEPPPEPCFDCACCAAWTLSLELLRDSIRRHVAGELRIAPCDSECLVCADIEWQTHAGEAAEAWRRQDYRPRG